ncbi:MAG: hypothetical protein BAJALOKI2v1_210020 [Promethearchaeota archaeon]|nr:MAG: hypothetical protein BAJALOKI2v1_210020 [Candidatus Lokiarchaeota archaeon]
MCNNCNCDFYDRCSIVGYLPIGHCCENCDLYDESHTCLKLQTKRKEEVLVEEDIKSKIRPISTVIEGGVLKVVIQQGNKQFPLYIDIEKQFNP